MRHQRQNRPIHGFGILALIIFFAGAIGAGCSDQAPAPPAPAPAASPVQKQAIVSAPTKTDVPKAAEPSAPVYSYNAANRIDPFAPIIEKDAKKAKAGDRPPLERYNITEMKLTGIVWGGFGYNAMIEGPDGKGYFVRTGTIIGPNRGVIKKITKDAIVIVEKFKTFTGETDSKEIIVELRKPQEEKL
jgi:type IV pilus assembly protein PilP